MKRLQLLLPQLINLALQYFIVSSHQLSYNVEEHWFNSRVDHFNYQSTTPDLTFPLRFCVHSDSWNPQKGGGSVLFYAGNEADIYQFINNTGFMFEVAHQLNSLVVFAEHRYYGKSKPFGNGSLEKGYNISFLTVEQAMQDFNTLNLHIREKWNMTITTPFIVFGGSYGGNLAMWLRLKQPNLWAGAIASSVTPLKHKLRDTNGFARIETEVYANVSKLCPGLVRQGWKELYEYSSTTSGRIHVANELSLCKPFHIYGDDDDDNNSAKVLHGWISNALETMAQYGYPYPTSFYNPVPAYPFKVTCENMQQAKTGLGALKAAASVYYNYTGQAGLCFDLDLMIIPNAKQWLRTRKRLLNLSSIILASDKTFESAMTNGSAAQSRRTMRRSKKTLAQDEVEESETDRAWDYQTCTEVFQPMPTNGITDFEVPFIPNNTEYFEYCFRQWNTSPRPNWEEMYFMGSDISSGSNIFITNGELDPWRAGGIQTSPKGSPDSIVVRIIEHGAHHLDLRASNQEDPLSVIKVRKEQVKSMKVWITEWKDRHS